MTFLPVTFSKSPKSPSPSNFHARSDILSRATIDTMEGALLCFWAHTEQQHLPLFAAAESRPEVTGRRSRRRCFTYSGPGGYVSFHISHGIS